MVLIPVADPTQWTCYKCEADYHTCQCGPPPTGLLFPHFDLGPPRQFPALAMYDSYRLIVHRRPRGPDDYRGLSGFHVPSIGGRHYPQPDIVDFRLAFTGPRARPLASLHLELLHAGHATTLATWQYDGPVDRPFFLLLVYQKMLPGRPRPVCRGGNCSRQPIERPAIVTPSTLLATPHAEPWSIDQ